MFKRLFFILRLATTWGMAVMLVVALYSSLPLIGDFSAPILLFAFGTLGLVIAGAFSHLHRVRMIAGRIDNETLDNRQKRLIEIPLEAGEAFDLVDAAIRELPGVDAVRSARDSLQVKAKVARPHLYGEPPLRRWNPLLWFAPSHNLLQATVTPAGDSGRVTLICEPESPAWSDWFLVDDGINFENAEAIARAITRRIGERRRSEQASVAQTATEKELTEAKLHLLHAQVEPHFLYNTLASAQLLTRSDPARAEAMLGHLIQYLRRSLPSAEDEMSSVGAELERALAYLEILKIRMGDRLAVQVAVPEALRATPLPAMMLQTLVENAIKHGLEPRTGGGTIWIRAHRDDGLVAVTVADDGEGFNSKTSGTGIGLKNVRERLRLRYAGAANLSVIANFPSGVAATLTVPASGVTPNV
ncbi:MULTISPECIES: histidine kinase [Thermomonas]|jgi:signal transduction histidine kinase|uniref:Histidine kinase n=1 Tax=Thermomonas beijingensis TaxID=2872701 RepID=A0ABS7TB24_9GAMM|nr:MULTISPECIES: histidine kinase [Thermomonas]MBS0459681.1 histidine kinase [Pseudomonadota bacterium]MDE2381486.1 histidine kinase [Xanthomonadaceae bacterium]MBZ4185059.1 histidine kinase [Thermomonas beijingensis]HOC11522.1 histidine kinase [Thermomonas sp.]HQA01928.1 histidine kinase [Thermomonas sp.]